MWWFPKSGTERHHVVQQWWDQVCPPQRRPRQRQLSDRRREILGHDGQGGEYSTDMNTCYLLRLYRLLVKMLTNTRNPN